ncbi:MAG: hypothetical protein AAFR31_21265, partial [Cyanobacteria bacterium J06627_8]
MVATQKATQRPVKMDTLLASRQAMYGLPILTALFVLVGWEIIVRVFDIAEFVLPTPSAIL